MARKCLMGKGTHGKRVVVDHGVGLHVILAVGYNDLFERLFVTRHLINTEHAVNLVGRGLA